MTTLTVSPEPTHEPPRVRIDVSTDDPAKLLTALTITRDGKPIREQPYIGGSETVVFDYEAPFGVSVLYAATGTAATYSVAHDETWASLTGWVTIEGTPSVAGGHFGGGTATRAVTLPAEGRLDCDGLVPANPPFDFASAAITIGSLYIQNDRGFSSPGAGVGIAKFGDAPWSSAITGLASPFSATWDADSATIITQSGTWALPRGADNQPDDTIRVATVYSTDFVRAFVISTGTSTDITATASTILDVDEAWLIHPTFSSLSCSIDPGQHKFRDDGINVDTTTKTNVGRSARSTTHEPPASRRKVVFTSGPRPAGEWDLVLRTRTLAARDRVDAICDDQSPLLLRAPQGWLWDLPDDWYSVGDYSEDRTRPRLDSADRLMTLPLAPVGEPTVRLAALWTYAADLLTNSSYVDARTAMPTYLDRLVGP